MYLVTSRNHHNTYYESSRNKIYFIKQSKDKKQYKYILNYQNNFTQHLSSSLKAIKEIIHYFFSLNLCRTSTARSGGLLSHESQSPEDSDVF